MHNGNIENREINVRYKTCSISISNLEYREVVS